MLDGTADGSITDEKKSNNNIGIGNLPVIEYMKQQIDAQCKDSSGGPVVSCADVVALAGREAFNFVSVLRCCHTYDFSSSIHCYLPVALNIDCFLPLT